LYRDRILVIVAIVILASRFASASAPQKQIVPLNSGWEFHQVLSRPAVQAPTPSANDASVWHPATVPGCVHLDLLNNKLIPDPFYRDNEAKLQWIENADWEYRTTAQATPALLAQKNIDLIFEGLDAYAKVYLNEKLILTADNMFREWRVSVKGELQPGANAPGSRRRGLKRKPTFVRLLTNMDGIGGRGLSPAVSGARQESRRGMRRGSPTCTSDSLTSTAASRTCWPKLKLQRLQLEMPMSPSIMGSHPANGVMDCGTCNSSSASIE